MESCAYHVCGDSRDLREPPGRVYRDDSRVDTLYMLSDNRALLGVCSETIPIRTCGVGIHGATSHEQKNTKDVALNRLLGTRRPTRGAHTVPNGRNISCGVDAIEPVDRCEMPTVSSLTPSGGPNSTTARNASPDGRAARLPFRSYINSFRRDIRRVLALATPTFAVLSAGNAERRVERHSPSAGRTSSPQPTRPARGRSGHYGAIRFDGP